MRLTDTSHVNRTRYGSLKILFMKLLFHNAIFFSAEKVSIELYIAIVIMHGHTLCQCTCTYIQL